MTSIQESRLKNIFSETLGVSDGFAELSQKNCAAWDSVAQLNLIIAVEAEFDVVFEPEEIAAMTNFSSLAASLSAKLRAKNDL